MKNVLLASGTALLIMGLAFTPTPIDESSFTRIDADGQPFVDTFNSDIGKVRLVMYVSPTCGGCLHGAKKVQKEVLSMVGSDQLAAYVVWAPKNGASIRHVSDVTDLVTDPRAHQYWDGHSVVKDHYDDAFALAGPCAGIFVAYDRNARWSSTEPPQPAFWQDAHANQRGRKKNPRFGTDRMVEQFNALLGQS